MNPGGTLHPLIQVPRRFTACPPYLYPSYANTPPMFIEEDLEVLKVDTEIVKLRIFGEPYVVYTSFGYQAAIDVWHIKKKRKLRLYLSAKSLASQLEEIRRTNGLQAFTGIEFWIKKASSKRASPYVLSE